MSDKSKHKEFSNSMKYGAGIVTAALASGLVTREITASEYKNKIAELPSNNSRIETISNSKYHGIDINTYNKYMELKTFFKGYNKSIEDMQEDLEPKEGETAEERKERMELILKVKELGDVSIEIVKEKFAEALENATGKPVNLDEIEVGRTKKGHSGITYRGTTIYEAPYDEEQDAIYSYYRSMPIMYDIVIVRAEQLREIGEEPSQRRPDHLLSNPAYGINGDNGILARTDQILEYGLMVETDGFSKPTGRIYSFSYSQMDELINGNTRNDHGER